MRYNTASLYLFISRNIFTVNHIISNSVRPLPLYVLKKTTARHVK